MTRRAPATGRPPGRPKIISHQNSGISVPLEDLPDAPPGLGSDGEKAWQRIWAAGSHLDEDSDFLIVQELCFLIDETALMRRALSLGAVGGGVDRTYRHSNGSIVVHPYVNQIKDNRAMIMSWISGLGFGALERRSLAEDHSDAMTDFRSSMKEVQSSLREFMAGGESA